ncbi:MAG TPA: signal peptidase I [Aquifex aeolicus]|uniref:Signal peptidase I n=1 Tax=Aquifex aeolicus TaxID=63363 RepID=A0A7C5Q1K5_AQUAO|nr:signal peptidase I [Aquifex aeolicus]
MKGLPRWLTELLLIVVAVLLIRATLVQAFNIPSASMQPTLLIGDFILVNKLVYTVSEPRVGDVVVFKYPVNPSLDYIKRIIAGPGDLVEFLDLEKNGVRVYGVRVNGQEYPLKFRGTRRFNGRTYYEFEESIPLDGRRISHSVWFSSHPTKVAGLTPYVRVSCMRYRYNLCVKFRVPEGHYFVMGDNRDNSEDSRFWGFVPRESILGKAFVIYFSGRVPPLTPEDVNFFTGFRQLFLALINPRFDRIGRSLVY